MDLSRRDFLGRTAAVAGLVATGGTGLLLPEDVAAAGMENFWLQDRIISCRRADTKEKRDIRFFSANQGYLNDGYRYACWLMRDAKDGNAVTNIDVGLLNLLYALQEWARLSGKPDPVITINSAYRTPRRNASIEGAARNSLHTRGKAVDITMRGVTLDQLRLMADYYKVGGIGIYDTFIHLDAGRYRSWRG
ncbi:hypothetical protein PL75_10075 [Neisseria arctica]|uniref:Murein endopeptidase K n=1 Tax=Neisseria arctica TaxID=1470200 RepID=A0A0J0YPL9_9NEIS|nr:DUF882 domain-containing protein [Neisseria arctica]KLT72082.1 hypothetical protein PL75_10075 [Neisseria arctica]UOO85674.1 DUF882 domain-containing protein [Neisseria arctica]